MGESESRETELVTVVYVREHVASFQIMPTKKIRPYGLPRLVW